MTAALDLVALRGDPRTRGIAHGRERAPQIARCLADWLQSLRAANIADPRAHLAHLLRDTQFLDSVEVHSPDLLEEVRGMAEGAGQPFELVYAAQLMDEEWAYRGSTDTGRAGLEKCSSVAVRTSDSSVLIGQNMDLGGYTDGHQSVLRIAPESAKPGALVFSISSMIGLMGVNTSHVGVCVNSIPQLPAARRGLPVAFVIRKLLQAEDLSQAAQLVRELPHATGQHYLLGDPTGIRSFEASSERVVELEPPESDRVFHTNHPLAAAWGSIESSANSVARLRSLRDRLARGRADVGALQAALASRDDPQHPVSRVASAAAQPNPLTGMIGFTTGSMISALVRQSDHIDSWISPGPPSLRGYTHFSLSRES